jgi:two-component system nitrogen regulation sensor histidine kinase GlnL
MIDKDAHQLIQNLSTSVLVFGNDHRLRSMNPAGENLLSISSRQSCGMKANELLPLSPHFADMIDRSMDSGLNFTERAVSLDLSNSRSITVDCMLTRMLDNEDIEEVIVEIIDTHALNRVLNEEILSVLTDATRDSLRGMAHEIKNPLGGLRGAAQLLEKELENEELKEYTQIIIHEADRLRNLIDKMSTQSTQVATSRVNIHEILEYVYNIVEAEANSSLNLERDYDPSVPELEADKDQLIQAILNIIRNAYESGASTKNLWISTRIKRMYTIQQELHKLAIQIEIIDDGPGVPPEIKDLLFYPMVTGRVDGTGLGLSISQSIIQAHGGIIEHERSDSRTIFRIFIPIK